MTNLAQANSDKPIGTSQLEWDADSLISEVSVPTLILASRPSPFGQLESLPDARHVASKIKGSHLRMFDRGFAPYWTDRSSTLEAIDAVLLSDQSTNLAMPAGFRTVVFTDAVDSTRYLRDVGDDAGRAAIRHLEEQVAAIASDHGGRVVKNLGDGSLVSFGSNSSAISFALEVQDECSDGPLRLRVGMAAGEPIQEDGDIHGTVVAQASRIGDLGGAGEIVVSDAVYQLAVGKGFTFEPGGKVDLRGFDQPQKIWKVIRTDRP